MVELWSKEALDRLVSHMDGVQGALRQHTDEVKERAEANLEAARGATTHRKISGPSHLTSIGTVHDEVDHWVYMSGSDAIAIEFGHFPSGHFAPEKYGKITKAPAGLYILTRAAGVEGAMVTPGGVSASPGEPQTRSRRIGKR